MNVKFCFWYTFNKTFKLTVKMFDKEKDNNQEEINEEQEIMELLKKNYLI